ncbi:hypothetical protein [Spiroplasma tabanidicola]|uniref:Uncharacterized protein n=1 Tax=Spiroplasma tabanidicola TaxID=324079 RepID=A0A6I6CA36_9MOLU|nr:hypothetical protein [Spiroplasma tabanidicola]QGS52319.1 hypothetical protein STABA_v1c09660 [Spiroplasma tabanidicola]
MKKILSKVFIPFLVVTAFLSITTVVLIKYVVKSNTDIIENTNANNDNDKEDKNSENIVNDFVENNLTINFSKLEKIKILVLDGKEPFINIDMFKYYFLKHFKSLGPKKETIKLQFNFDELLKPKIVKVFYNSEKFLNTHFLWYFMTKYI